MAGYWYGAGFLMVGIMLILIARPRGGEPAKLFRRVEWLIMIYPAIVLGVLAFGVAQIVFAAML